MRNLLSLLLLFFNASVVVFCGKNVNRAYFPYKKCADDKGGKTVTLAAFNPEYSFVIMNGNIADIDAENQNKVFSWPEKWTQEIATVLNKERLLTICLCRSSFNQIYFVSPFLNKNGTLDDAIFLCLVGSKAYENFGIYDEQDFTDLLMIKYAENMPVSIKNPLSGQNLPSACLDEYGFPTKDILGQQTCLLTIKIDKEGDISYLYSGPLLGNAVLTFDHKKEFFEQCFTTVNETQLDIANTNNQCMRDLTDYNNLDDIDTIIHCWCHRRDECSKIIANKNRTFCVPKKHKNVLFPIDIFNEKVLTFPCSITAKRELNDYDNHIEYGNYDCAKNYSVSTGDRYCSSPLAGYIYTLIIQQCCYDGHFCNKKLKDPLIRALNCFKNKDSPDCDRFYDIELKQRVNILLGYNAIQLENQREWRSNTSINTYEIYAYLKIIKYDPDPCYPKLYDESNFNKSRPFIIYRCDGANCSNPTTNKFGCQFLNQEKFDIHENVDKYVTPTTDMVFDGWICFVSINYSTELKRTTIEAGELKDFDKYPNCLMNDFINQTFCCSSVFDISQDQTKCTVEKMILKNKKFKNSTEHFDYDSSHCIIHDLPDDTGCPSDSQCFETRSLEYSHSEEEMEPQGCVEKTEELIERDIPLASLSLGCRVPNNANGCSLIRGVEGIERVLCCCNGIECSANYKMPKEVGKKISSFKSPTKPTN